MLQPTLDTLLVDVGPPVRPLDPPNLVLHHARPLHRSEPAARHITSVQAVEQVAAREFPSRRTFW
jgi:hypothetical protein